MTMSCCTCELTEAAQSLGDGTHEAARLKRPWRHGLHKQWSNLSVGGICLAHRHVLEQGRGQKWAWDPAQAQGALVARQVPDFMAESRQHRSDERSLAPCMREFLVADELPFTRSERREGPVDFLPGHGHERRISECSMDLQRKDWRGTRSGSVSVWAASHTLQETMADLVRDLNEQMCSGDNKREPWLLLHGPTSTVLLNAIQNLHEGSVWAHRAVLYRRWYDRILPARLQAALARLVKPTPCSMCPAWSKRQCPSGGDKGGLEGVAGQMGWLTCWASGSNGGACRGCSTGSKWRRFVVIVVVVHAQEVDVHHHTLAVVLPHVDEQAHLSLVWTQGHPYSCALRTASRTLGPSLLRRASRSTPPGQRSACASMLCDEAHRRRSVGHAPLAEPAELHPLPQLGRLKSRSASRISWRYAPFMEQTSSYEQKRTRLRVVSVGLEQHSASPNFL